ncbi:MAG: glutamine synthetase III [Parachlamydiaceae bacterium]|nr:glutamine synthetase III [Parachlamydiaceae bacterium]
MSARFDALRDVKLSRDLPPLDKAMSSENFGSRTFSRALMQKMLPAEVYKNVSNAMNGLEKIRPEYADTIALAVKEWALSHGCTHYCHWFQPLTGASAEKHDAFIDWNSPDSVIEKFNGKQLLQGEPDASSFPSGGLRSTYEARGYTGWDPSSPIFLWKAGDGMTLCIPSIFFSWTGAILDTKIPLLRSDWKINQAASRLLELTGVASKYVYCTLGLEQEYFAIDRALRNLRPDLVLLGKTVFGASPSKGQELQDHYFGSVKDRILSFMCEFEAAAIELGIPVKTRHNEVAPSQYEVAPVFEKASAAIDHNILLMELMRQIAQKHQLACLLHEKPFARINGSGKHANWSLSTDQGLNLLDPSNPANNWHFCLLLAAILHGVHRHSSLLRAAIGSASNDYRLGGHEAPPAIMSIFLGDELETFLNDLEHKGSSSSSFKKGKYDLGHLVLPDLSRDNTDRNRTSPFAFTGNKFEFRAVGSSSNPAFPVTVLNLIVAESLNAMLDEIEEKLPKNGTLSLDVFGKAAGPVLQKYLKASKNIRFSGDNYSSDWVKEANKRKLPNITKSPEAFEALTDKKTIELFKGVLTEQELASRQDIMFEIYASNMNIEAKLMVEIFNTQILSTALEYQRLVAESINQVKEALDLGKPKQHHQLKRLKHLHDLIENALTAVESLENATHAASRLPNAKKATEFSTQIIHLMEQLREFGDEIETLVDDRIWPLPKYRELLFMI